MFKSKRNLIWWVAGVIPFVVATSGCATRRYVRNKVNPVSQQVAALEAQTNEKIAAVSAKHDSDISQVNERISSTDLRVTQVAAAVQQAQGTASRAMDLAEANANSIKTTSASIDALKAPRALDYQLVANADVTFGFDKSTLTKDTKAALDQVAQKVQSLPNPSVELAGFTDRKGTENYNLVLSRKRAEAVQRYLAKQNVPVRAIHIIGLGEETPPAGLQAGSSSAEMARRVSIRIFDGNITSGSAARAQQ